MTKIQAHEYARNATKRISMDVWNYSAVSKNIEQPFHPWGVPQLNLDGIVRNELYEIHIHRLWRRLKTNATASLRGMSR